MTSEEREEPLAKSPNGAILSGQLRFFSFLLFPSSFTTPTISLARCISLALLIFFFIHRHLTGDSVRSLDVCSLCPSAISDVHKGSRVHAELDYLRAY